MNRERVMRAADLMTGHVLTARPYTTIRQAASWLSTNGFTALPVVDDDGVLVGIVTESDLIRDRFPADPRSLLSGPANGHGTAPEPLAPATVGEVMSSPATALPAGTDVAEVARTMFVQRIRSLPIVDGGRVVGIITRRDLVRCLARSDAEIATDVRRRLEVYGGPHRWSVSVRQGRVAITDTRDDPVDAHVAKIIAQSVAGVEFAKVVAANRPETNATNVPGPPVARPFDRAAPPPETVDANQKLA